MLYTKFKVKNKMAIIPMAIFFIGFLILKSGVMGNQAIENSASAASFASVSQLQTPSPSANFLKSLQKWREDTVLRSKIYYKPHSLYELTAHDIKQLFGSPALSRQDGSARMIQYRAGQCVVDFYFQEQLDNRIVYFEFRDRQKASKENSNCQDVVLSRL
jgi:hypothetical protein